MNLELESTVHALQRFTLNPKATYSIDSAAHLAGVARHWILVYCRQGLISPLVDSAYGGFYFDEVMIRRLQQIEYLRADCAINFAGIRIILGLMEEVQRLRERVRE